MRKIAIALIFIFVFMMIPSLPVKCWAQESFTRPEATSPDGLKATSFKITLRGPRTVGTRTTLTYKLTNVTDHPITFSSEYGICVGCRCNDVNKDYGHRSKGVTLQPNQAASMKVERVLDAPGAWRFWPAYHTDGHWGPYRWNEIVFDVTN
jgi:hypothetical protein